MKSVKLILILLFFFGLTQCRVVKDEASTYFTFPKTTKIILKQDIPVPPTDVVVTIQFGKIIKKAKQHYPFCELEVRKKNDMQVQSLPKGEYAVVRVVRETGMASMAGVQLASAAPWQIASAAGEEYFTTQFILSKDSGNIRHLSCKQLAENNMGDHLSLKDIRHALGDLIHIEL